jgi:serine/threonine protein kinase
VGTLMYVAPEALSGEMVKPAADQYSLATITYFLLTGCLPFVAKSQREMFTQLLTQPPIPLNKARPGLTFPPAVEEVVMRGLAKQPAARYPDVEQFAGALRTAVSTSAAVKSGGLLSRMKGMLGTGAARPKK